MTALIVLVAIACILNTALLLLLAHWMRVLSSSQFAHPAPSDSVRAATDTYLRGRVVDLQRSVEFINSLSQRDESTPDRPRLDLDGAHHGVDAGGTGFLADEVGEGSRHLGLDHGDVFERAAHGSPSVGVSTVAPVDDREPIVGGERPARNSFSAPDASSTSAQASLPERAE